MSNLTCASDVALARDSRTDRSTRAVYGWGNRCPRSDSGQVLHILMVARANPIPKRPASVALAGRKSWGIGVVSLSSVQRHRSVAQYFGRILLAPPYSRGVPRRRLRSSMPGLGPVNSKGRFVEQLHTMKPAAVTPYRRIEACFRHQRGNVSLSQSRTCLTRSCMWPNTAANARESAPPSSVTGIRSTPE